MKLFNFSAPLSAIFMIAAVSGLMGCSDEDRTVETASQGLPATCSKEIGQLHNEILENFDSRHDLSDRDQEPAHPSVLVDAIEQVMGENDIAVEREEIESMVNDIFDFGEALLADTGLDLSRAGKWKAGQFRTAVDYMGSYYGVDLDSEAVTGLLDLRDRPLAVASLSGEGGVYDWAASIADFSLDYWKAEYEVGREFVLVSNSLTGPEEGLCKISKCFCPGGKCQEILGTALTDVLGGIGGGLIGGWIGSLIGAAATSSMFQVAWHCCRYPD